MDRKSRLCVAASVSVLTIALAPAALAQTVVEEASASRDSTADATSIDPATQNAPPGEDGPRLEDVVVTAQRREERALRVPVAITTITASALETQGATSTANLAQAVPGLQINRSLNSATPFLRGVGNPSGAGGEEGATAIYIDGVYSSNQYANMFEFNDIDRIEVLKGPQGTLFGRNSAGGAILVTTKTPRHDFGLDAAIGYANFDTLTSSVYVTGGLSETVAASLSFQGRDQGKGWGRNLTTGAENGISDYWTLRGKLLWELGARTRVTVAADYYRQKESLAGRPVSRNIFGFGFPGFWNSLGETNNSTDMFNWGGSLRVEHDADPFQIVSLTAFRKTRSYGIFDFDATPLRIVVFDPLVPRDRTVMQEFQFQSNPTSPVKWVAGVFLYHNVAGYYPFIQRGLGTPATAGGFVRRDDVQTTDSYAGFAQATIPVIANTNLTLGGRYSIDDRRLDYTQTSSNPALNVGTRGPVKVSYPKATWRVSLDHQFTPDIMAYASVNTGFKSGLFNLNTPTDPAVAPETVTAYEAGFKGRMLDGRLQVEAAVFHTDFEDIQLRSVLATGGTRLLNAANARINGAELGMQVAPAKRLTLSASLSVLDTKFTRFLAAPATIPLPAVALAGGRCPAASAGVPTGGNLSCIIDAEGNHLIQAPPFSANASASYEIVLPGGSVLLNAAYGYTSHFWWEPDNRLTEPEHHNVNASIAWRAPDNRWSLRFWGRNLTNERRNALLSSTAAGDASTPGEPRTYGLTLTTHIDG